MKIKSNIPKNITNENITKATKHVLKHYKTQHLSNNNIKITSKTHLNSKTLQNKKQVINKIKENSKKLKTTKEKQTRNKIQSNKNKSNKIKQQKKTNMKKTQTITKKKIDKWKHEEKKRKNVSRKKIKTEEKIQKWWGDYDQEYSEWHNKTIKNNPNVFEWLDFIIHVYMYYQLCFTNEKIINDSKLINAHTSRTNYETIYDGIINSLKNYLIIEHNKNIFYTLKQFKIKNHSLKKDGECFKKNFFSIFNKSKCSNKVEENLFDNLDLKNDLQCIAFTYDTKFNRYDCSTTRKTIRLLSTFYQNSLNKNEHVYYLVFRDTEKYILFYKIKSNKKI